MSTQNLSISEAVARDLLEIKAVEFNTKNPFKWVSGIESPFYCDNRKVMSYVEKRRNIVNFFTALIKERFPTVEIICGVATGGIPLGILVAEQMGLPFIYVRATAKEHGLKQQVEGFFETNKKVVLIEDHISTGLSSIKGLKGLKTAGLDVIGLMSIMTYNFNVSEENFKKENIIFHSLTDFQTIVKIALETKVITKEDEQIIEDFYKKYNTDLK